MKIDQSQLIFTNHFPKSRILQKTFFSKRLTLYIGPDLCYSLLLILLIFLLEIAIDLYIILKNTHTILFLSINLILLFFLLPSFLTTAFKNPGLPNEKHFSDDEESNEQKQFCSICNISVNETIKISHCNICNICILGYDHHCLWSSKCIGEGNLMWFYLFIISFLMKFVYNIFIILFNRID